MEEGIPESQFRIRFAQVTGFISVVLVLAVIVMVLMHLGIVPGCQATRVCV